MMKPEFFEICERGLSVLPSGHVIDESGHEYRDENGNCFFVDPEEFKEFLHERGQA